MRVRPSSSRLETEPFWSANQPGIRFADEDPGSEAFFSAVEDTRYSLEPHILEVVDFARWRGQDVLEVGCGIGTDGLNFARHGANYTGVDQSPAALGLATRRFDLAELQGHFRQASADALPFPDGSFDLVYSHGVIHHMRNTPDAVDEFSRVLRPGGVALVMVYHRCSLNYWITIFGVRRFLAGLLLLPGAVRLVACIAGERESVVEGHKSLLRRHGLRYLRDRELFLSNNTDGPGNPLTKVYTIKGGRELFAQFEDVRCAVRNLNLRIYPGGQRVARSPLGRRLEKRWGWHLYLLGRKGSSSKCRLSGP